jgi:hypothetical protein
MPISVKKAINSAEKSRKKAEKKLVIETEKREAAETKAKKERYKAAAKREAARAAQAERDSVMRGDANYGHFTKKGRAMIETLIKEGNKDVRRLSSDLETAKKRIHSQTIQIDSLQVEKEKAVSTKKS